MWGKTNFHQTHNIRPPRHPPIIIPPHFPATSADHPETPSLNSVDSTLMGQAHDDEVGGAYPDRDGVRRFECPAGFFRLRRHCYYLSAGTAPWRDAHFQCTARNATLAVLSRHGKDKILRKYLMGEQFRE